LKTPRQNIDGVLLLNKPIGWTSNAALQKARWLLNAAKAGHTGTLDPFASGLLPICFGQAAKFSSYALHGNKTYRATLKLGITTTTGDTEGERIETRPVNVSLSDMQAVLPAYTGEIHQVPPMYSALKHQGRPLYEYARSGIEIERKPRNVTIFRLELVSLQDDEAIMEVDCSGGTYIRTLAEDIGKTLGCGAHLIGLERTASGSFTLDSAISLGALEQLEPHQRTDRLLPPDVLVTALPRIEIDTEAAQRLKQGKSLSAENTPLPEEGAARVYSSGEFIGLVTLSHNQLRPARLMATN
jgi:tRNA pseudouridine55 synthase